MTSSAFKRLFPSAFLTFSDESSYRQSPYFATYMSPFFIVAENVIFFDLKIKK